MDKELTILQNSTYDKVRETVLTAKNKVYSAVNFAMVEAYWEIGKEIYEAQGKPNVLSMAKAYWNICLNN